MNTYHAMIIVKPGQLKLVEKQRPTLANNEVLIAVEACGICGADIDDIDRARQEDHRVPGHEVVGRIIEKGSAVAATWGVGQRVGIGRFGGYCQQCDQCRQGHFHLCLLRSVTGVDRDGGYAELMTASTTGLVAIPEGLSSVEAAPLLCAGIATFNALKSSGAEPGDSIAVLGIGGLGHMAVQYARRMGFHVVAIGRGQNVSEDALALGAHRYIDLERTSSDELSGLENLAALLTTIGDTSTIATVAQHLRPRGRLVLLGVGKNTLNVSTGFLISGERLITGSITGTPYENERALGFSVLCDIRPRVETMPLAKAQEGLERVRSGDVKFRMVLTMKDAADATQH